MLMNGNLLLSLLQEFHHFMLNQFFYGAMPFLGPEDLFIPYPLQHLFKTLHEKLMKIMMNEKRHLMSLKV